MHLLGVDPGPHPGDQLLAHGLAVGLTAHPVEVVHAVEDDGEPSPQRLVPQIAVLVHAGEGDALPHRPTAEGGVADIGHHDAGAPVGPFVQGGPRGDRARTTDDGIVGVDAEGGEKGMHGPAQAPVETGLPGKDLAVGTVDKKPLRQAGHGPVITLFHRRQHGPVAIVVHYHRQFVVAQRPDGRKGLGQDLTVAAVRAEDVVLGPRAKAMPTAAASWPMDRWAGPAWL